MHTCIHPDTHFSKPISVTGVHTHSWSLAGCRLKNNNYFFMLVKGSQSCVSLHACMYRQENLFILILILIKNTLVCHTSVLDYTKPSHMHWHNFTNATMSLKVLSLMIKCTIYKWWLLMFSFYKYETSHFLTSYF